MTTMSEISIIHFLKITGMIDGQKKNEFERTVKFACGPMCSECIEMSLSVEIAFNEVYYFFISWSSEKALRIFIDSNEYQLVRSAYDALGVLQKIEIGYNAEIKTIHIYHF
jgi:hypothetical protein